MARRARPTLRFWLLLWLWLRGRFGRCRLWGRSDLQIVDDRLHPVDRCGQASRGIALVLVIDCAVERNHPIRGLDG
jgi:hypothetical protein